MCRKTAILSFFIVMLFGCTNQKKTPINVSELTMSQIHDSYKKGNYTSEQLVKQYIERIQENDSEINSISIINPDAILIAKELDKEFQKTNKLRPLHGIPIIIKDNINTKNLPTTGGALALKDFIPEENAFVVKKLIEAGAIIIAKSNMAEWAFSAMHTESSTKGTTRNPYNLDYVPAGSSGGTAAAVASNFATIGLGTDTGNSIRGPSSHNALIGFRTTLGLISREGIIPLFLRNDVVGPMGRTVEDATRVLEIMIGIDPKDEITNYSKGKTVENYTQFLKKDGLKGSRIGVLRELSEDNVDAEVKNLFEKAIVDLNSLGAEIIDPIVIPNFAELRQNQWCSEFKKDVEDYLATYVKNDTIKTIEDIIRIGSTSEYASDKLVSASKYFTRWGDVKEKCFNAYKDPRRIAFREAIEKVMDSLKLDAIIYPTWNNKPARIDFFEKEYLGDNNQVIAPHTGQPAFTVPMGFTKGNLPAGLQFLGRMYAEPTLIRLAYSYEQGTLHRKEPK
ncbi:MAG: amidase [Polaribacter sp.]|jgi:amidase